MHRKVFVVDNCASFLQLMFCPFLYSTKSVNKTGFKHFTTLTLKAKSYKYYVTPLPLCVNLLQRSIYFKSNWCWLLDLSTLFGNAVS